MGGHRQALPDQPLDVLGAERRSERPTWSRNQSPNGSCFTMRALLAIGPQLTANPMDIDSPPWGGESALASGILDRSRSHCQASLDRAGQ